MKKVTIAPGCISCGTCEAICPDVFVVEKTAKVKPVADINKYDACIREAADMCPMQVIVVDDE